MLFLVHFGLYLGKAALQFSWKPPRNGRPSLSLANEANERLFCLWTATYWTPNSCLGWNYKISTAQIDRRSFSHISEAFPEERVFAGSNLDDRAPNRAQCVHKEAEGLGKWHLNRSRHYLWCISDGTLDCTSDIFHFGCYFWFISDYISDFCTLELISDVISDAVRICGLEIKKNISRVHSGPWNCFVLNLYVITYLSFAIFGLVFFFWV